MSGSTPDLQWHPDAILDARAAYRWYLERNPLVAAAFLAELDNAVAAILEAPATWPRYVAGTRRFLLRRFPFFVVYRERGDRLEVLAVAHSRKRPGYWRKR